MQVKRRPQPILQGALEWWWLFRVVPVETSSQAFVPQLQPAVECERGSLLAEGITEEAHVSRLSEARVPSSCGFDGTPTAPTTSPLKSWPSSLVLGLFIACTSKILLFKNVLLSLLIWFTEVTSLPSYPAYPQINPEEHQTNKKSDIIQNKWPMLFKI